MGARNTNIDIAKQHIIANSIISLNSKYKDVYREIMKNDHQAFISEANHYFSVYNMHFKLPLSTE